MVIFDYVQLQKAAEVTKLPMLSVLSYCKSNRIPKRSNSKLMQVNKQKVLAGYSFIINPTGLMNSKVPTEYVEQYITLAAKRSYSLYKMYGYKNLPLSMYPDLNQSAIKFNPLLKCTDTELVFLLE